MPRVVKPLPKLQGKPVKLGKSNPGTSPKPPEPRADVDAIIEKLFILADLDGSGELQFREFLRYHGKMVNRATPGMEMDQREIEMNFRKHDQDTDHQLDRKEFVNYMNGWFNVLGKRSFMEICNEVAEEEMEAMKDSQGYCAVFSLRLIEQSQSANYYKPPMQDAALRFIEQKADPNYTDRTGSSMLLYAADRSEECFIARLLEARCNPFLHNESMECAALRAAFARNMDVLDLFLLPNVHQPAAEGVHAAQERASQDLIRGMNGYSGNEVKELLRKKANPNYKDDHGWTPLTAAVFWGKQECLETLLRTQTLLSKAKLRLNAWNGRGRSALHVAARKGRHALIPLLVAARGDPDCLDIDGWSPLHHASYNGMNCCVKELLSASADLLIQGRNGMTPYMCTKLPSHAGTLNDEVLARLAPSKDIKFADAIIPVLKKASATPYEKLLELLELPGVRLDAKNLRLHEQFFDPKKGPNKVRLRKMWEGLALPMIQRLHDGETDVSLPSPGNCEEHRNQLMVEIVQRRKEQKRFVHQWMVDTRGPRPADGWTCNNNRAEFSAELEKVLLEELNDFEQELDKLYGEVADQEDGDVLVGLPAEEVLNPLRVSQICVHPIPTWIQDLDLAEAFEALRLVGACGTSRDDDEALMSFVELLTLSHDFDTGHKFWHNSYKLWLSKYAEMADKDFQKKMQDIVTKFNETSGMHASYRAGPVKTYERMSTNEMKLSEFGIKTYEGRTCASKILDVVRGSITVDSPAAAVALFKNHFLKLKTSESRLELVRYENRFNEKADTLQGYRNIVMNIVWDGGLRAGKCGRPDSNIWLTVIGEVQICLEALIAVRKRRHLIYKFTQGDFDWPPEEPLSPGVASPRGHLRGSIADMSDDDDLPPPR